MRAVAYVYGLRVQVSGLGSIGFRVQGLGFCVVFGLGFTVQGLGVRSMPFVTS